MSKQFASILVAPEDFDGVSALSLPVSLIVASGTPDDVAFNDDGGQALPLDQVALRSGVIPMATDAGAVTEVLLPWENGVVLSQDETVAEALSALARLAADPDLVLRLSARARADMEGRDWGSMIRPFAGRLDQLLSR